MDTFLSSKVLCSALKESTSGSIFTGFVLYFILLYYIDNVFFLFYHCFCFNTHTHTDTHTHTHTHTHTATFIKTKSSSLIKQFLTLFIYFLTFFPSFFFPPLFKHTTNHWCDRGRFLRFSSWWVVHRIKSSAICIFSVSSYIFLPL